MEIISVSHTNFLVKVDLTWVQDPCLLPSLHEGGDQHIEYYLSEKISTR